MEQDLKKGLADLEKMVDEMQEAVSKAEDIFGNFDGESLLDNAGKELVEPERLSKKDRKKKAIEYARQKYPKQIKMIEEFCLSMEGISYIFEEKTRKLEEISDKAEEIRDLKEDLERDLDGIR